MSKRTAPCRESPSENLFCNNLHLSPNHLLQPSSSTFFSLHYVPSSLIPIQIISYLLFSLGIATAAAAAGVTRLTLLPSQLSSAITMMPNLGTNDWDVFYVQSQRRHLKEMIPSWNSGFQSETSDNSSLDDERYSYHNIPKNYFMTSTVQYCTALILS